jgi:hypothetical protein
LRAEVAATKGLAADVAARVEIGEARLGGFFLYRYDPEGRCIADTWHPTLAEAREQATFEFDIAATDWVEVRD